LEEKVIRYEICLPVFKQGDDLALAIDRCDGDVTRALLLQAENYAQASMQLIKIAASLHASELTITADTHTIDIEGPRELLDELVARGLVVKYDE
jgi:hypothetical protein